MNDRCFIGNLRLCLQGCLEDIGCHYGKDGPLYEAFSQIQRRLNSTSLFVESGGQLHIEVQNCVFAKGVQNICLEDLEGLACDLIAVLVSESNFITHSVAKTFLALFDYLHGFVSLYVYVTNILWIAVKECFGCEQELKLLKKGVDLSYHVRKHGQSTCGFSFGNLFQILHDILKKLKQEGTPHLDGFLTCSATHMHESIKALNTHFKRLIDNSIESKLELKDDLMLAVSLRLLSSFMHSFTMCDRANETHRIVAETHIVVSLVGFLEAISNHCLNPQQKGSLSSYLRHKFLMLMFRLHNWFTEWPVLASTCSEILRSNASTLCPSLFVKISPLSPLSGSPFAGCLAPIKTQLWLSPSDLQPEKYAIFLIFKVELSLIKDPNVIASIKGTVSSSKEKEAEWICKWILSKISLLKYPSTSHFAEFANHLASSFLQTFMDEDTLLLDVLLLLQECYISELFSVSSNDGPSQITPQFPVEIFKPVRLLAVFLSLISYDHLVIIDFLIERSTGTLCLQYLLRSMRFVRNTWPELLSLSDNTRTFSRFIETGTYRVIDINKVGMCIVKLRDSIARLHEKQAFPYNPSSLLKHLEVIEGLVLEKAS